MDKFALPIALCLAALSPLSSSQQTSNATTRLDWKPPKGWHQLFPYFISGVDKAGRPIMILELGKWDMRSKNSQGPETAAATENYFQRMVETIVQLGTTFDDEHGMVLIQDFEGLQYRQLAHGPTILMILRASRIVTELETAITYGWNVNANYVTEQFLRILQPLFGSILARLEPQGTNKERWIPKLLAEIPKSQLPPWYGGNEDWKPLQVLGKGAPIDVEKLRIERSKVLAA